MNVAVARSLPCCLALGLCAIAVRPLFAAAEPEPESGLEPPQRLVQEVVYNELNDHKDHHFWRYWVQQHVPSGNEMAEQVETADGPIMRVLLSNGRPLDEPGRQAEQARLDRLAGSQIEQAVHRQEYVEDEKKITRIMAMLPDAFLFDDEGEDGGLRHLRFRPNPAYATHSIESKVFHAVSGDLWIDARMKRMARIEGHLDDNVDFGLGMLGRVNKGSWFRMVRRQVSPTEWKTSSLDMHVSGRAMLFKTIAHETSQLRWGFTPVPQDMTAAQGVRVLEEASVKNAMAMVSEIRPVSLEQSGASR